MKTFDEAAEQTVRQVLIGVVDGSISEDIDLWPAVRSRLDGRAGVAPGTRSAARLRTHRRTLSAAALAGTVALASGLTAAAASPRVRDTVGRAVAEVAGTIGISVATNSAFQTTGQFTVSPTPSFRYAELNSIPSGLTEHAFGYIPNPDPIGDIAVVPADASGSAPMAVPGIPKFRPSVWFRYFAAPPGTDFLEVVEQPAAAGYELPGGVSLKIAGDPARMLQQDGQTTVALLHAGTTVTISTSMGKDVALSEARVLTWL